MNKTIFTLSLIVAFVIGSVFTGVVFGTDGTTQLQKMCAKSPKNPDNLKPECELLNMIKSITLTPGPQGPVGLTGPAGNDGVNGLQGPAGNNGSIGPKGDSGTPAKVVHLIPSTCGPREARSGIGVLVGWCPDGSNNEEFYFIKDIAVKETSVIVITMDYQDNGFGPACAVTHLTEGDGFLLRCGERGAFNFPVRSGTSLNYAIINP